MAESYKNIPLRLIREDPNQPRRSIDDRAIEEMAETMKTVGVIEPVLVVPDGERYKLVVGHRRFRAARKAGLTELPCVVRPRLSELEAMRMQAVEDAQTAELDPRDRYAFWAKLWKAEKSANDKLTLAQFAKGTIGKSEGYVKAGIQVAEEAPAALKELLGKEEGKLNPTYARYLVNDSSLSASDKVAVAKKIVSGAFPASGGKIGTETLRVIRAAPPTIRRKLISDPDYSLEHAKWELRHHDRQRRAEVAKREKTISAAQVGFKLLKAVLEFHVKLDPKIAPWLPDEAWEEIETRLSRLERRIAEFRVARTSAARTGRAIADAIDVKALAALLAQEDEKPARLN